MKHYLFVNRNGKKFKVTQSGKKLLEQNAKLAKSSKLLGECDDKGLLVGQVEILSQKTIQSVKEILQPVAKIEVKFEEKPQDLLIKIKNKNVKKTKAK